MLHTQANQSILNDRGQYHYEYKVSYINFNKKNHIRLAGTFSDELKRFYLKKHLSNVNFCKLMSKMSMARNRALPASIDDLIENSIKLYSYIATLKPVEKGSNQLQSIV